ncbi:DUF4139 domain-containing protein [Pseudochryseolinea flava]|nr:DUF4139 domain-containing protein [Pseudochryseolinea flava]
MKNLVWTFVFLISIKGYAQSDKITESKITNVTVFLNNAQVTRTVNTQVAAGNSNIILTGLTAYLDQASIQVSGKGDFVILGIAHYQNYLDGQSMPTAIKQLKDSLTLHQRKLNFEQSRKEILTKEEVLLQSNQHIAGTTQNLTAAELKAMADFYRARLTDIVQGRMLIEERLLRIQEKIARLEQQISEKHVYYTTNTSEIVVRISAAVPAAVALDVQYIVANAGWTPQYDLRAINTKRPVQLNYKANVFQATGEEWNNVKLKLSTANPNLSGLKPTLEPWYLTFQQSMESVLQGKVAGVQLRGLASAPAMDMEMKEEDLPAQTIANYTTTIQTTLNTEFDISLPYTVSASNKPTLVDIRNYELKADYLFSVVPKLDLDAFLMAKLTGWEDLSLLRGEANIFFEGTFVGKSFIDPRTIKDTLSVSLGRDKRIVVKREKLKDYASRKFIGMNQRDSYAYEISVRNAKMENIKLIVEDQIPVSQDGQIEVIVSDAGGAYFDKTSGKLRWEFALTPNESKQVVFKFDVKFPKGKMVTMF